MPKHVQTQPDLPIFPDGREPKRSPSSMRGRAFVRLLAELQELRTARLGLTLEQLAASTGVTTRTIRRDLEVLQEAGIAMIDEPVEHTRTKRWRVFGRLEVA